MITPIRVLYHIRPPPSAAARALAIPHILDSVIDHVKNDDLPSCATVTKEWFSATAPRLYGSLTYTSRCDDASNVWPLRDLSTGGLCYRPGVRWALETARKSIRHLTIAEHKHHDCHNLLSSLGRSGQRAYSYGLTYKTKIGIPFLIQPLYGLTQQFSCATLQLFDVATVVTHHYTGLEMEAITATTTRRRHDPTQTGTKTLHIILPSFPEKSLDFRQGTSSQYWREAAEVFLHLPQTWARNGAELNWRQRMRQFVEHVVRESRVWPKGLSLTVVGAESTIGPGGAVPALVDLAEMLQGVCRLRDKPYEGVEKEPTPLFTERYMSRTEFLTTHHAQIEYLQEIHKSTNDDAVSSLDPQRNRPIAPMPQSRLRANRTTLQHH